MTVTKARSAPGAGGSSTARRAPRLATVEAGRITPTEQSVRC